MGRGGVREGAGRPKPLVPVKMRSMRLTDDEYEKVKKLVKELRKQK